MKDHPVARVSVTVGAPPDRAFEMFVKDIGRWWKKDQSHWLEPERALDMRIEPFVGGRWLEVYDLVTGKGTEIGRVTLYEPGRRLAMVWRLPFWPEGGDSDLEIRFMPLGVDGTRIDLTHDLSRSLFAPDAGHPTTAAGGTCSACTASTRRLWPADARRAHELRELLDRAPDRRHRDPRCIRKEHHLVHDELAARVRTAGRRCRQCGRRATPASPSIRACASAAGLNLHPVA